MRRILRRGDRSPGGITGYPLDQIYKEVAFIAYYFHWGYDEISNIPHGERKRWCEEISDINKKLSEREED